ncbi:class I SAM-dependent methyltransferase [Haloferacaceae archaeon DSL9]
MFGPGDVRFFDRFARLYDLAMPPADPTTLADGLDRATRPIDRLVDLGGGTGRATVAVDGCDRLVVDLSRGMLRRARERGVAGVQGDAGRLPLADESVDAMLLVDALHHMPEQSRVLLSAARALRPGGVLVVRDFDSTHPLGRVLETVERRIGMNSTLRSPGETYDLLETAGFEPTIADRGFGYTVVGVVPQ